MKLGNIFSCIIHYCFSSTTTLYLQVSIEFNSDNALQLCLWKQERVETLETIAIALPMYKSNFCFPFRDCSIAVACLKYLRVKSRAKSFDSLWLKSSGVCNLNNLIENPYHYLFGRWEPLKYWGRSWTVLGTEFGTFELCDTAAGCKTEIIYLVE